VDGACVGPAGVQRFVFDAAKYPNIRRHFRRAVHRRGWPLVLVVNRRKADERHVPSSENRSHGATLGALLEPFCNGVRFRYVFR
jgi:hypothetical protein